MKNKQTELTTWEQEQLDRATQRVEMEDAYTREIRRIEKNVNTVTDILLLLIMGALIAWLVSI